MTDFAKQAVTRIGPPLAAAILLVVSWSLVVRVFQIEPYLAPTPRQVGQALSENRATLLNACRLTGQAALGGLMMSVAGGTLVGVVFAKSRWLRYAFYPYAIFLQTVPIVAIAPLLILWFGYGKSGVLAVAFILSFFPIVATVTAGMLSVPSQYADLFQLHRASRLQRFMKLEFPYTIPHLITGVKTSSGLSVIGAIVGEFFVGYGDEGYGLGYLIRTWAESYRTDGLFSAVLLATLLGVVVFATVSLVAEFALRRYVRRI